MTCNQVCAQCGEPLRPGCDGAGLVAEGPDLYGCPGIYRELRRRQIAAMPWPVPERYADANVADILAGYHRACPDAADAAFFATAQDAAARCVARLSGDTRGVAMDPCLLLSGGYGSGKTHMACAIANGALDALRSVAFCNVQELLSAMKATFDGRGGESGRRGLSAADLMDNAKSVDLCIVDDYGNHHATDWAGSELYGLVNQRYSAGRMTIITTNLTMAAMAALPFGGAIVSRVQERSLALQFPAFSFRKAR